MNTEVHRSQPGQAQPPKQNVKDRFVYQDDQEIDKGFDWSQVKRMFHYVKPYSKQLLPVVIVMMLVGAITKLTIPLLFGIIIDKAIAGKKT